MIKYVLVALVLATRVAAADDGDAERLYKEGQAAYDTKRYIEAITAWDKAYALSKLPALVFNLAQAHRLAGHCREAYAAYLDFIRLDPEADDRPAAEQFMRELDACGRPPPVPIQSRKPPVYEDRGRGLRIGGIVVGAGGLVAVVTGIYFGNRASTLADEIRTACDAGCEWAALESKDADGHRAEKLQYVFYGAGAAAVAGGVWLYLRGAGKREVLVEPQPAGGMVKITGRF